jgi:hypothetical protein
MRDVPHPDIVRPRTIVRTHGVDDLEVLSGRCRGVHSDVKPQIERPLMLVECGHHDRFEVSIPCALHERQMERAVGAQIGFVGLMLAGRVVERRERIESTDVLNTWSSYL